ncbi:MAG: hypothetical protein NWR12_00450, partial [Haliea sp.]|nr:hypothetical protein [Haliea sp.]
VSKSTSGPKVSLAGVLASWRTDLDTAGGLDLTTLDWMAILLSGCPGRIDNTALFYDINTPCAQRHLA